MGRSLMCWALLFGLFLAMGCQKRIVQPVQIPAGSDQVKDTIRPHPATPQTAPARTDWLKGPSYSLWPKDTNLVSCVVRPGDTFWELFGPDWEAVAKLNRMSPRHLKPGQVLLVPMDLHQVKQSVPLPGRLKTDLKNLSKLMVVSLNRQVMGLYEQGKLKQWYPICGGRPTRPTPTGIFRILTKDRDHVSRDYPKPDGGEPMPYALRFYYTYWVHAGPLPGKNRSHGCVRLMLKHAQEVFAWAPIKTWLLIRQDLGRI